MSRIRDIAKVTMREARGTERIEDRAWLVWRSLRTAIEQGNHPGIEQFGTFDVRQGIDGYRVRVSLNQVILALWPEWSLLDKKELSDTTQPIYSYLKTSCNAVCVKNPGRDSHVSPTWWVRDTWFGGQAIVVPQTHHPRPADRIDTRAQRLTPAEAGEDREPAPVTVIDLNSRRHQEEAVPEKKRPRPSQDTIDAFIKARDESRARRNEEYSDAVITALIEAGGWATAKHLGNLLGKDQMVVKRHLDTFVADGLVERGRRIKTGTLYRAVGASDDVAGESNDGPGKSDVSGANRTADVDEPVGSSSPADGDVVDMSPTVLPGGNSVLAGKILALLSDELGVLDVERITRERDDALLRADVLRAENQELKKKLAKFKKLLED